MRECYFTEETIVREGEELLGNVRRYRRVEERGLDCRGAALLVLDMQHYFFDRECHAYIPSGPAIVPHVKELQEGFMGRGCRVLQTRHVNTEADAGQMGRWWRELLRREMKESRIIGDIEIGGARVIEKSQYDAFYQTELEQQLRDWGVCQVVITGVMTHLCCETTARSAFMRGFEVFFVVDATATYNRQFHESSLINLSHGFAVPVLTGQVMGWLS